MRSPLLSLLLRWPQCRAARDHVYYQQHRSLDGNIPLCILGIIPIFCRACWNTLIPFRTSDYFSYQRDHDDCSFSLWMVSERSERFISDYPRLKTARVVTILLSSIGSQPVL